MARNVIPSTVSFSCDCCACDCGNNPALSLHGMRNHDEDPRPYTLDLCTSCLVKFDEWIETQKVSHE